MLNMAQAPLIFDRKLLAARRARAAKLGPATFLIDRVADEMDERLSAILRKFERAADVGTPNDAVRRALAGRAGSIATALADDEAHPWPDRSHDPMGSQSRVSVDLMETIAFGGRLRRSCAPRRRYPSARHSAWSRMKRRRPRHPLRLPQPQPCVHRFRSAVRSGLTLRTTSPLLCRSRAQ